MTYENPIAPVIWMATQKIISIELLAWMSPYPMVVMVVTQKYIETMYSSPKGRFWNCPFSIQEVSESLIIWEVLIQMHANTCSIIIDIERNRNRLSNPSPNYRSCLVWFRSLPRSWNIFITLISLITLIILEILESLTILAIPLMFILSSVWIRLIILERGSTEIKSIKNQPLR